MVNTNAMLYGMMTGQQVGQYHLESLLGVGGFGGVFLSNEVVLDRVLKQVAVKVIPGNDEQQLQELLAAATLDHDHLIRCYTAGECHLFNVDALYLVMELAEKSLDSHLQGRRLETEEIRQIIGEVASGLAYLHSQNQVHRDLKPANVLRVKGRWKLSDFGLVRHLGANSYAQTANPIGTIAYMPPEAFEGKISAAWDIWSLGIMVVQMVSQTLPYRFSEPTQLLKQVMNGAIALPPLPEEFRPIVEGCLQVNRGDRWSIEQVLEALRPQPPIIQVPSPLMPVKLPKEEQAFIQSATALPRAFTTITEDLGEGVTLELVQLPAGGFMMGSPDSDPMTNDWEKPQHLVVLKAFAIGKYPITQKQYKAVMGNNPSEFRWNSNNPVERVSWNDAQVFCEKLSQMKEKQYRLPSEAEWEYACKAGTKTKYFFGNDISQLEKHAWFADNSGEKHIDSIALWQESSNFYDYKKRLKENGCQTHPVGEKYPNGWGLYDMYGNVWEWCEDEWHDSYEGTPDDGSARIEEHGSRRVLRGGSWLHSSSSCRSSHRPWYTPDHMLFYSGFRVVVAP